MLKGTTLVLIGAAAIAYFWWKSKQEKEAQAAAQRAARTVAKKGAQALASNIGISYPGYLPERDTLEDTLIHNGTWIY